MAHLDIILLEIFSHRFVGQTLRRLKRSAVGISIIIEIDRLDLVILFVKRGAYGVGSNLLGAVIPIQVIAQHAQAGIVQIIVAHHINIHTVLSICKVQLILVAAGIFHILLDIALDGADGGLVGQRKVVLLEQMIDDDHPLCIENKAFPHRVGIRHPGLFIQHGRPAKVGVAVIVIDIGKLLLIIRFFG